MIVNQREVVRGTTVTFVTEFLDASNQPVTPDSPVVCFARAPGTNASAIANVALASNGAYWTGDLDTTAVAPGIVYYFVLSGSTAPKISEEGDFCVRANPACPF